MSVRTAPTYALPDKGDARFFALLQHQGEVLHRIGVPKTDETKTVMAVKSMRVGNLAVLGPRDEATEAVVGVIDTIHTEGTTVGKHPRIRQTQAMSNGVVYRVVGIRRNGDDTNGSWEWKTSAIFPGGETVDCQLTTEDNSSE